MAKAFIVKHPDSGQGVVVIAENAGKARAAAIADDIFHDCEFLDPVVRRAPEFDDCKIVPTRKELVDKHCWWFECECCGEAVHEYNGDRRWIGEGLIFCNHWCRAQYRERTEDDSEGGPETRWDS